MYLKKASDDLISHCHCGDGRVTFPSQMDCPWCGCGWLFCCITCRKAFTFAEGVEIDATWEETAREDLRNQRGCEPSDEEIVAWIETMRQILMDVEIGHRYVILDGTVFPVTAADVEFDGWYAHHEFRTLPQVDALADPSVIDGQIGKPAYWIGNALKDAG